MFLSNYHDVRAKRGQSLSLRRKYGIQPRRWRGLFYSGSHPACLWKRTEKNEKGRLQAYSNPLVRLLKSLFPYLWRYRFRLIAGLLFVSLSNYFNVLVPQVTGFVVDFVQRTLDLPGYQPEGKPARYDSLVQYFVQWVSSQSWDMTTVVAACGLTILGLALVRGIFLFLMRQTLIVMSRHIEYAQKADLYEHLQQMGQAFFRRNRTGDLMNRISEDVGKVRMFTGPALMYFANLFTIILFCLISMLRRDVELTLYVLSPLPILAYIMYRVNERINQLSEQSQAALSDVTVQAQETYSGIRVVKSYGQEDSVIDWFRKQAERYRGAALGLSRVEALYFPSIALLIGLSTLLTILIGGLHVMSGHGVGLSVLVEFVLYINMLTFPVSAIGLTASLTHRAAASQGRIDALMHTSSGMDLSGKTPLPQIQLIEFKGVDFVYPDTGVQAASKWSFTLKKGERYLIVGSTGSGKSTLAQMISRLLEPTSGTILINQQTIGVYDLKQLRLAISYVPQDVFLFSDTIEANLRFGQEGATEEEVIQVSKAVCLHEEVLRFPEGYRTMIGERGVTLSGGQKQRLALARALLKPASFYILDDCLSAVDVQTERRVLDSLDALAGGCGWVLITNRVPAHVRFDWVICMNKGELVEQGTPAELVSSGGIYSKRWAEATASKDIQ